MAPLWKRIGKQLGLCTDGDAVISTVNPLTQKSQSAEKGEANPETRTSFASGLSLLTGATTITAKSAGPSTRLTQEEIRKRTDASKAAETIKYGDMTLQYCYVSQRGFYPDELTKENQDKYCLHPQVLLKGGTGERKIAFFGVFDGHGKSGHHCARFVETELPKTLFEKLEQSTSEEVKATEKVILQSHKSVSDRLLNSTTIDTKQSGTTSITVLLRDRTMYVSNVGDSRAIMVSKDRNGKTRVSALSSDHTPYRKDERFRIMKYGARILSIGQLQSNTTLKTSFVKLSELNLGEDIDEGGDPPRVWAKDGEYPGTAFTRSFGDAQAEQLGVTAEPEVLVRELTPEDKFVIIASDGVFEFLTNQMVADIIETTTDPVDACRAVVQHAYDLWLQYDVRSDDVTILLIKLVDVPVKHGHTEQISAEEWPRTQSTFDILNSAPIHPSASVLNDSRPVRRALTREKMKKMLTSVAHDDSAGEDDKEGEELTIGQPKSATETYRIANAVKFNFLFQDLSEADRKHVIDAMQVAKAKAGDWVITQGERADRYYIVEDGKLEVRVQAQVRGGGDGMGELNGGELVHVYQAPEEGHPGFGELGMLYNKSRAASVIAVRDCKLWTLDRRTFKKYIVASMERKKTLKRLLRTVPLLACLNTQQVRDLADNMSEETYEEGDTLVTEGEKLTRFFVILSGECACSMKGNEMYSETVLQKTKPKLLPQDAYGVNALLAGSEIATTSVVAKTAVKVLFITRRSFEDNIGKLDPLLDAYRESSKEFEDDTAPKEFKDIHIQGLVSTSQFNHIFLGQFGDCCVTSTGKVLPNTTVRSYLLREVDKDKSDKHSVINAVEALKVISKASDKCYFVVRMVAIFHQPNALHLVFDLPLVADLNSLLRARSEDGSLRTSENVVCNIAISVFSGLEFIHEKGMVYRSVHPEGIYIDAHGQAILGSFRATKVGAFGKRTYTICGAAEYLAPEMINRQGHSMPVDLWALGCLLYEIATGVHPFAAETEVDTFTKISSYGTRVFPKLDFPPWLSEEVVDLIEKLLVPIPDLRLGAGAGGYKEVKEMFQGVEWDRNSAKPSPSPLAETAAVVVADMVAAGVDRALLEQCGEPYSGRMQWESINMH